MDETREDEDRSDVRRVLAGDVEAFEGIVGRWQGPLVNLAYRYCRNRGRAEEMAQDAFLKTFRSLDRWRGESAFSTWLFAVAINVYRSDLRRRRPPELPLLPEREVADPSDPGRELERSDLGEVVRRSVSRLPGKYRDALVLVYFHELDVGRAAGCLGVPQGTLKARLHRGRELLRRRLADLLRPRTAEVR